MRRPDNKEKIEVGQLVYCPAIPGFYKVTKIQNRQYNYPLIHITKVYEKDGKVTKQRRNKTVSSIYVYPAEGIISEFINLLQSIKLP